MKQHVRFLKETTAALNHNTRDVSPVSVWVPWWWWWWCSWLIVANCCRVAWWSLLSSSNLCLISSRSSSRRDKAECTNSSYTNQEAEDMKPSYRETHTGRYFTHHLFFALKVFWDDNLRLHEAVWRWMTFQTISCKNRVFLSVHSLQNCEDVWSDSK